MSKAQALHMAHAIESIAVTNEDGLMDLGYVDTYAEILGISVDEADCLMDEALKILEEEGIIEEVNGEWYKREEHHDYMMQVEEDRKERKQQMIDERMSYDFNIWG